MEKELETLNLQIDQEYLAKAPGVKTSVRFKVLVVVGVQSFLGGVQSLPVARIQPCLTFCVCIVGFLSLVLIPRDDSLCIIDVT